MFGAPASSPFALILTASDDATADYVCERLIRTSFRFLRLDTDKSTSSLRVGYDLGGPQLITAEHRIKPGDINAVWFRRPGMVQAGQELQGALRDHCIEEWSEAIEGFLSHIPVPCWINHPSSNAGASHKLEQLTRAKGIGLRIPRSLVTQDPNEAREFWRACGESIIVKPLSGGYLPGAPADGPLLIYTNAVSSSDIAGLSAVRQCPTFFQERVDKSEDVRVSVIDNNVIAVGMRVSDEQGRQRLDIRRNEMEDVTYSHLEVPQEVLGKLRSLTQSYGLRFAAIDMAITTAGDWCFFELNPNGQWAWLDFEAGTDIGKVLLEAFSRDPRAFG